MLCLFRMHVSLFFSGVVNGKRVEIFFVCVPSLKIVEVFSEGNFFLSFTNAKPLTRFFLGRFECCFWF